MLRAACWSLAVVSRLVLDATRHALLKVEERLSEPPEQRNGIFDFDLKERTYHDPIHDDEDVV